MQFVTMEKASAATFASAGHTARQYIAACALVEAQRTKAVVFGHSFEASFEACRRVGTVNGLLAAAEGRYTRGQLQAHLFRGMAQWCWTDMGSRFLDLCVAIPSQRALPAWAVKVREARSDSVNVTELFNGEGELHHVEANVEQLLSIIDSPLAHLMALLRIPMGATEGVPIATALEFRIAHLWLLSDFFHNLLPTVHEGLVPPAVAVNDEIVPLETVKDALASEKAQNAVLRTGGDVFANALSESFPTSSGAVKELAQSGTKVGVKAQGNHLLASLMRETRPATFTKAKLLNDTQHITMGVSALQSDTSMRGYKLIILSLTWVRVYNLNVALLFHMHAMSNRSIGNGSDDDENDEALSDEDWRAFWLPLAGAFHTGLSVRTEEDLMSVGTYGDPQSIFDFHTKYQTLKAKVRD